MIFLLDTNILVHYIRKSEAFKLVQSSFAPFRAPNIPVISVVTVGEIRSFAGNASWGTDKLLKLEELLAEIQVVDLQPGPISDRYAEIDIFSQGNLPGKPLGQSARNMGKNDLWIAATASLLGAKLLTTDADFDHLNGVFLDLERILT